MNNIYWIKVEYYEEFDDQDHTEYGTLVAESFNEALEIVESYFKSINKINIEELVFDSGRMIMLPPDMKEVIRDANQY